MKELKYKAPASNWNEALPMGNGKMGAMIYGNIEEEIIKLNDETIWYRGHIDRNNPDSLKYLDKIRELLLEEKIQEAEKLTSLAMYATPRDQSHFAILGDITIKQNNINDNNISNYERQLDISKSLTKTSFLFDKVLYKREYFVDMNKKGLFVRYTSSDKGKLNLEVKLGRHKRFNDGVKKIKNGLIMEASAGGKNGTHFQLGTLVHSPDGDVEVIGETVVINGSSEVIITVTSDTNYYNQMKELNCEKKLKSIPINKYENILENHIKKYQSYFNRVNLSLGKKDEKNHLTIDERLKLLKNGESDPKLLELYFDYGRYLLISSSQPGGLPANLQGIWSDSIDPIWGSKYTININIQMNYWLTGPCDLPELEYPLLEMLDNMRENGRVTAKKMYGADGFAAHHNTDGYFDTAPQSRAIGAAIWPMTVAWLATHIWEHFEFTQDIEILTKYYPLMKEAVLFYDDYLFMHDGKLYTGPSVSPENKYRTSDGVEGNLTVSPTIDNQILRYFFNSYIKTLKVLGKEKEEIKYIEDIRNKLPKTEIGKHGQIQEWIKDYEEVEPGHRHMSQLFGLHPADEISFEKTPDLAKAAEKTIERRLAHSSFLEEDIRSEAINNWTQTGFSEAKRTGWSLAWMVNFYARLKKSDLGLEGLYDLLKHSTLDNLLCDHPPFQIDGNFGAVNGICEMLIQSHQDFIEILPALPKELTTGSFKGVKVRGGQKVDLTWEASHLKYIKIFGNPEETIKLKINAERLATNKNYFEEVELNDQGQLEIVF